MDTRLLGSSLGRRSGTVIMRDHCLKLRRSLQFFKKRHLIYKSKAKQNKTQRERESNKNMYIKQKQRWTVPFLDLYTLRIFLCYASTLVFSAGRLIPTGRFPRYPCQLTSSQILLIGRTNGRLEGNMHSSICKTLSLTVAESPTCKEKNFLKLLTLSSTCNSYPLWSFFLLVELIACFCLFPYCSLYTLSSSIACIIKMSVLKSVIFSY